MKKKIFLFLQLYIVNTYRFCVYVTRRYKFMIFRGVKVGVGTQLDKNVQTTFCAELNIGATGYLGRNVSFENTL